MIKIFLINILLLSAFTALCQSNNYIHNGSIGEAKPQPAEKKEDKFLYGPVKFRELKETIGETYIVLPLPKWVTQFGYVTFYKGEVEEKKNIDTLEGPGKLLILKAVDDKIARFTDSSGVMYTNNLLKGHIMNAAPVYDIDESRRLFLNKTLWMNQSFINTRDGITGNYSKIEHVRFERVKVIDIVVSERTMAPVRFIVKTENGITGFADAVVSGTNMDLEFLLEYMFENVFFTKDPKLTYKFTPAMWQKIKDGETEIGMTEDQVRLSRGRPDKINRSSGAGAADQWVYGNSYLYFRNGKLTTIQN